MRRALGLAVLVLTLGQATAAQAQFSATGVNISNLTFTPVNGGNAIYTPGMSSGGSSLVGFDPMSFFHSVANLMQWPPQVGNSSAGTLTTGPNPFPTTPFPFPKNASGPIYMQLPTSQVQTSFSSLGSP